MLLLYFFQASLLISKRLETVILRSSIRAIATTASDSLSIFVYILDNCSSSMCLPRIISVLKNCFLIKKTSDNHQIQAFSWISFTKLWVCLWISKIPLCMRKACVSVNIAYLGVTEFSLSRLFAILKV